MSELLKPRRVFVCIFGLGLFVMACRSVTDPDVWWHLRTGELILQSHHIFRSDPYSFTRSGTPWVDHEWLSQVIIYCIYRVGSWAGLTIVFGIVVAAGLLLAYLRSPGKPYVAILMTLVGAFASAPSWGVRPQMFTFLLASAFLFLLERSEEKPQILFLVPPLMLLWANLHAGYAVGIGLIVLFIVGEALDCIFGFAAWTVVGTRLKRLTVAAAASIAAVVVNPYGLRLYAYPFETLHSLAMQSYIGEWFSPDFHDAKYFPLILMILGSLLLPAISSRKVRPRDLLLVLLMTYAALRSVRHIPIYVLVTIPMLSGWLDPVINQAHFLPKTTDQSRPGRIKAVINGIVLAVFLIFVAARLGYVVGNQQRAEKKEYPAGAVAFLRTHAASGPMLNHYNWGGYLIWNLYPQYKVFVDGRADVYGDDFMNQLASLYYVKGADWQAPLHVWGIRTAMLPPDAPLTGALVDIPGWTEVYRDSQAVILVLKQ